MTRCKYTACNWRETYDDTYADLEVLCFPCVPLCSSLHCSNGLINKRDERHIETKQARRERESESEKSPNSFRPNDQRWLFNLYKHAHIQRCVYLDPLPRALLGSIMSRHTHTLNDKFTVLAAFHPSDGLRVLTFIWFSRPKQRDDGSVQTGRSQSGKRGEYHSTKILHLQLRWSIFSRYRVRKVPD